MGATGAHANFRTKLENVKALKQRCQMDSPPALPGGFKQQRLSYPSSLTGNRLLRINLFSVVKLGKKARLNGKLAHASSF